MATTVAAQDGFAKPAIGLPGRRYDHYFFSAMALAMLATVFIGFARTYYLAGVFSAPLPSRIIHLHGAAFSCWILLLVTQTSLVAAGRVDLHRKLGIAGFFLACAMLAIGFLAATDSLVRDDTPRDAKFFYIIPTTDILIFGTLVFFAFRNRANAAAHKRYIMIATTALLIAAMARWPVALFERNAWRASLATYVFLLALLTYDWWSTRKIHRVTLWASAFLIFIEQVRFPIGRSVAWHHFAGWVQAVAR